MTIIFEKKQKDKPRRRRKPSASLVKQVTEGIGIKSYMKLKRTIRDRGKWKEISNI